MTSAVDAQVPVAGAADQAPPDPAGDGHVRPGRRHVDHECLDLGGRRRPRHRRECHPVRDRARGPGLGGLHPDRQQDRRPVRTQAGLHHRSARLHGRRPGDGPLPDRAADLHLLGGDRWPRRVAPAAGDAVAHPRQLRRGGPEGDLRPGRGRGGDRGGRRTADRWLHHDLPVVSRRVPARGRRHRDRAGGQPARPRRAVHRAAGDRPRRRGPVGPRHGRTRAQHPRLAGGGRSGRPAHGDRRGLARRLRLVAGAPEARREADAHRPGSVQVHAVQVRDLRAAPPERRARWRDDHHPDLPADGPRVQRAAVGPVARTAFAQHVRHGDRRRPPERQPPAEQHHPRGVRAAAGRHARLDPGHPEGGCRVLPGDPAW